jgi:hypothetical protein
MGRHGLFTCIIQEVVKRKDERGDEERGVVGV